MKPFFSFLIIVLTLTPSFSASEPELSLPETAAEIQASNTLTLSELILEVNEMRARIIEKRLDSDKRWIGILKARGKRQKIFIRHLYVHAAKALNQESSADLATLT